MELLSKPEIWMAFFTLLTLEIVLGIDNIVFISILAGKLPEQLQAKARTTGLLLALGMRLALLFAISWVIGLSAPWFTVLGNEISGRDLILIVGGIFLLGKSTFEIHERLEGSGSHSTGAVATASFAGVLIQIMMLDVVFSLDSVITAVGMVEEIEVMVAAVVVSIAIMLLSAGVISDFVNRHPTVKMLALSFLLLIGATLVAEGLDHHIPKGYIYGPIAFSIFVEALNLRVRQRGSPVQLHNVYSSDNPSTVSSRGANGPAGS
jgi:predicted tellurium resistance membrane protein TerC